MKNYLILSALLFSGCAELRKGWVRVDFLEGNVAPEMVCQMKINPNADIEAKCVSLKTLQKHLLDSYKPDPLDQL